MDAMDVRLHVKTDNGFARTTAESSYERSHAVHRHEPRAHQAGRRYEPPFSSVIPSVSTATLSHPLTVTMSCQSLSTRTKSSTRAWMRWPVAVPGATNQYASAG